MNNKELIERIAAGLRQIKTPPDFFLFIENHSLLELNMICGIPILFSCFINKKYLYDQIPVLPMWKKEKNYSIIMKEFRKGFLEYNFKK